MTGKKIKKWPIFAFGIPISIQVSLLLVFVVVGRIDENTSRAKYKKYYPLILEDFAKYIPANEFACQENDYIHLPNGKVIGNKNIESKNGISSIKLIAISEEKVYLGYQVVESNKWKNSCFSSFDYEGNLIETLFSYNQEKLLFYSGNGFNVFYTYDKFENRNCIFEYDIKSNITIEHTIKDNNSYYVEMNIILNKYVQRSDLKEDNDSYFSIFEDGEYCLSKKDIDENVISKIKKWNMNNEYVFKYNDDTSVLLFAGSKGMYLHFSLLIKKDFVANETNYQFFLINSDTSHPTYVRLVDL